VHLSFYFQIKKLGGIKQKTIDSAQFCKNLDGIEDNFIESARKSYSKEQRLQKA